MWASLAMPLNVRLIGVGRMLSVSRRRRRVGIPYLQKIVEKHVLTDPHKATPSGLTTATNARYRHWRPRNHIPLNDDLPRILTTMGMVKLCNRPENKSSPLIGLDVAPSNFGVAISDETRTFALPVTKILRRNSTKKLDPSVVLGKLKRIIDESATCALVVGWPLSKSGHAEGQCLMVLQFLRQLHLQGKVDIPVTLWDERLTSVEARDILREDNLGRRIADWEDEISAMVILQGFLDSVEADRGGLSTLPKKPGDEE